MVTCASPRRRFLRRRWALRWTAAQDRCTCAPRPWVAPPRPASRDRVAAIPAAISDAAARGTRARRRVQLGSLRGGRRACTAHWRSGCRGYLPLPALGTPKTSLPAGCARREVRRVSRRPIRQLPGDTQLNQKKEGMLDSCSAHDNIFFLIKQKSRSSSQASLIPGAHPAGELVSCSRP